MWIISYQGYRQLFSDQLGKKILYIYTCTCICKIHTKLICIFVMVIYRLDLGENWGFFYKQGEIIHPQKLLCIIVCMK